MTGSGGASGDASPLRSPIRPSDWIEWDFRGGSLRSGDLELTTVGGAAWRPDEIAGGGIHFDGVDDHLRIDAESVGPLDAARSGNTVSVVALVRRSSPATGFVAGMWQEDDTDPRRQYGLFVSLPTYGGAHQVIGHVSADGKPSGALPYSRDYSASARMVPLGAWRVVGFSYDGTRIVSYLDGLADARPSFTEVGEPLGEGASYPKNPYRYDRGLNRDAVSDFTVGAVRLTSGMGNHFGGDLARLAVSSSALSPRRMLEIARAWTPEARPLAEFDFARPAPLATTAQGGYDHDPWPAHVLGWAGEGWIDDTGLRVDGECRFPVGGLEGVRLEAEVDGDVEVVLDRGMLRAVGHGVVRAVRLWAR